MSVMAVMDGPVLVMRGFYRIDYPVTIIVFIG
jgi:hypothetical protein